MRPQFHIALGTLAIMGFGSVAEAGTARRSSAPTLASADIAGPDGQRLGIATVVAEDDRVVLKAQVSGLTPGAHGIHLHTTGRCDGPAFTTAGGHLNPGHRQHGLDNPSGSHLGDLPNIVADGKGSGTISVTLSGTRDDVTRALFDSDGTALVIHADADDNMTDPAGNSGGRIACGVFQSRQ